MTDLNNQDDIPTCRICHCTDSPSSGLLKLISPCHCSGSLKYVHHSCLQQWLDATNSQRCELCKQPFSMSVKYKPLYKWGSLNASPSERRRLICNSVFNLVSMICIFWSIYVLIERASLDATNGQIDWSFYVKISVVTIGLIIGVIFLFVQLKLYFSIFMKWRQSNRIIIIRDSNNHHSGNSNNTNSNLITTIKLAESTINTTNNNTSSNSGINRVSNGSSNQQSGFNVGDHQLQETTTTTTNSNSQSNEDDCKKLTSNETIPPLAKDSNKNDFFAIPIVSIIEGKQSATTSAYTPVETPNNSMTTNNSKTTQDGSQSHVATINDMA